MENLKFVKPEKIWLADHPELREKWVQERIADDPSILGIGDLVLKDKERSHPRAGRLDLLLQDSESTHRYEVEIQLGSTDESHIIRTIEYWDIERKRYPQYDHSASLPASILSLLLPCFSRAFLRGSHTSTSVTCGFSRSYSQAAQVPSSKVTCKSPRRPWMNCRTVFAFVSITHSITTSRQRSLPRSKSFLCEYPSRYTSCSA